MENKKNISLTIICGVLAVLLILSLLTQGFGVKGFVSQRAPLDIAGKAVKFINENFMAEGITATLVESNCLEKVGLCKFSVSVKDQTYDSYVSDDGKLLFPEAIDIDETAQTVEEGESQSQEIPKRDNPDVTLFVMAYCPYGNQAEDLMAPVVELLGKKVNVKLGYVIYSNYAKRTGGQAKDWCLSEDEKYCSMHGINELNQDIRELCVQKYQPDKLWDFISAINEETTEQDVEQKWENIAASFGINVGKIKTCQKNEGEDLAARELAANEEYDVHGSPMLLINETLYQGPRTSEGYKQAICSAFTNPPSECQTVLEDTAEPVSGGCQ